MKYKTQIVLTISIMILTLCICAGGFYVDDYYHANETALQALTSNENVEVIEEDGMISFIPKTIDQGFIFYPGGKVEYTAYSPLLKQLAENNTLCILVEMPFNLAVLDIDKAEGIPSLYPEVNRWYIGGHSLGGSMAATYLHDTNESCYDGLVLLASYSTADFSSSTYDVISIYGSEDQVLNLEKYHQYSSNLPKDTIEIILSGGNHAQFGSYGEQKKDGTANISPSKQIHDTTNYLLKFFYSNKH